MKKVVLHQTYIPLGIGLKDITLDNIDKKWIYLVPSATLISNAKEYIIHENIELQRAVEITTFDHMMRKFMVSEKRKALTQEEQELLVKRAIEKTAIKKDLKYFKDSIAKTGFVHQVEMWIGEMKRAGIEYRILQELWQNQTEKFQELSWIYEAYQDLLSEYSLIDHEEPYFSFLTISDLEIPKEYAGIITDQFYDFSPLQMLALDKLAKNGYDVRVHLATDENRSELFQWTNNTIRFFQKLGFELEKVSSSNDHYFSEALNHIMNSLFSNFPERIEANNVKVMTLAGQKQEIETIAAEIKYLSMEKSYLLDDIVIIVPQVKKYYSTLKRVMSQAFIPIRLSKKELLISNPYIQSVISLLKALSGKRDDWLNFIYSPYFKWERQVDPSKLMMILRDLSFPITKDSFEERFPSYLKRHEQEKEVLQGYSRVMNQIFHLMSMRPLKGKNKDFVAFVDQLEEILGVKENIKEFFLNNPANDASYRDIRAFEKWQELKKDLVLLDKYTAKGEVVSFWNWIQSVILASEKSEYNYSQGRATGVHILEPNQIRGRQFQVAFILGLIEGEFPRYIKNDWLMPDNERYLLSKQGYHLNLSRDYEKQQKYQFFQSLLSAKERVYLVYSAKTEDGNERLRSFYVDECLDLFTDDSVDYKALEVSDVVPKEWKDCIYEGQLLNKIYYTLKESELNSEEVKTALAGLNKIMGRLQQNIDTINRGLLSEHARWETQSSFDGYLKDENNIQAINKMLDSKVWSTTQLNLAATCRFSYFAGNILKLTEWEDQEESLTSLEKGDIQHRILQRFFDYFRKEKGNTFSSTEEEQYYKILSAIAEEEWNLFKNNEGRFIDPIISHMDWQQVKKNIFKFLNHELYWRNKSSSYFYPKHLELSFGMPVSNEAIVKGEIDKASVEDFATLVINNRQIRVRGKIDRIDENEEGNFVIYDYKSGSNVPMKEEILEGLNFQLSLYLLVLESLFLFDLDKAVGAAFYTKGNKKGTDNRNAGLWKSELLDLVGINQRVSSQVSEDEWKEWLDKIKIQLGKMVSQLTAGDFEVIPNAECPSYCAYKNICRKDEKRISLKKKFLEENSSEEEVR